MVVSKRVANVLRGMLELNDVERQELFRNINDYVSGDFSKRRALSEEIRKSVITFGPAPNTCVCCGK